VLQVGDFWLFRFLFLVRKKAPRAFVVFLILQLVGPGSALLRVFLRPREVGGFRLVHLCPRRRLLLDLQLLLTHHLKIIVPQPPSEFKKLNHLRYLLLGL
jgi:hypothetical protein